MYEHQKSEQEAYQVELLRLRQKYLWIVEEEKL